MVQQVDRGGGNSYRLRLVNAGARDVVMFERLICAIGVAGSVLLPTPASAQMT